MGKYQPNDNAAKSLQQKKNKRWIEASFIIKARFIFTWLENVGKKVQDVSFFKQKEKKEYCLLEATVTPFFLHYHVKAIILLIFTNSTWFFGSLHEFFTALHKFKPFSVLPTGCWQKTFFESCNNCFCKIVYFWIPTIFWVLQMFPKHSNFLGISLK